MLIASPLLMRNVGHVEEINCSRLRIPRISMRKRRYESVLESRKGESLSYFSIRPLSPYTTYASTF